MIKSYRIQLFWFFNLYNWRKRTIFAVQNLKLFTIRINSVVKTFRVGVERLSFFFCAIFLVVGGLAAEV